MRRVWLGCLITTTLYAAASVQPQQLRCEYRANPQGIDVVEPRLSWILTPANPQARALRQTAYRVLVSTSERALEAGAGDLWDSGKVPSGQSIHVVYRGRPLTSSVAAFWKVQVWDQDGQASEWSQPARWSMGLLRPEDWQGKWIGREESGVVQDPGSPYRVLEGARWIWDTPNAQAGAPEGDRFFRETFTVPTGRKIVRAMCIIALRSGGRDGPAHPPRVHFIGAAPSAHRLQPCGATHRADGAGRPCIRDADERQSRGARARENGIAVRMDLRRRLAAAPLGVALMFLPLCVLASSLERFSEFINGTLTARGEFEQKIFDANRRLLQESRGVLAFSRPGRFRWSYVKPYAQLIVGDGSKVWIYDEDLKQVTVKKLDQALGSTPAALLAGNNEAMRAFRLSA